MNHLLELCKLTKCIKTLLSDSLYSCISISLCPPPPFSITHSLCVTLCHPLSFSVTPSLTPLFLSPSLYHPLYFCHPLCVCVSQFLSRSRDTTVVQCHCSVFLSLSATHSLSLSLFLSLSHTPPSLFQSPFLSLFAALPFFHSEVVLCS